MGGVDYKRVNLISHFECAQLMSVWCAMASQCRFQSEVALSHVDVCTTTALSLRAHIPRSVGYVCTQSLTYLLLFFFSSPFFLLH